LTKSPKLKGLWRQIHAPPAGWNYWRPGDPALTVGQVADRLKSIAPDIENTISKVRHWSREGMISPIAQAGAGTGKHRLYAESAVYEAAILMATTSAGMNVASTLFLTDGLTQVRFHLAKWRKERCPLYLCFFREASPPHTGEVALLSELPGAFIADLTIVINLAALWAKVDGEGAP
jgi:hypothetical protein